MSCHIGAVSKLGVCIGTCSLHDVKVVIMVLDIDVSKSWLCRTVYMTADVQSGCGCVNAAALRHNIVVSSVDLSDCNMYR